MSAFFHKFYIIKLIASSSENILFCFLDNFDISKDKVEGNTENRGKTELTLSQGGS